jgi:hypothetical protein
MVVRNQNLKIIHSTHTTELAIRFVRNAKTLMDAPNTKKFLKQDYEKIRKPRVNGRLNRAVNIMQPVLVQRSRAVVRIY